MYDAPTKKELFVQFVQFYALRAITQGRQSLLIIWDVQHFISVEHVM